MKRLEPKKRGLAVLAILLVATSLAATATGLVLKAQLQKYVGGWEDRLAIAVPFMLLHDNTDLRRMEQAEQRSQDEPKQPEQPTEPEKPAEPEQPTEPEKPDEPEKPQVPGVPTELPTVVPGAKYGEDESFFDDALFIGDSRMVSSAYYARLGKADYFTDVGMNVFQMFSVTASDDNFDATDLTTLLQNRTYKKIFIMLGINECGYPMSSLLSAYQEDIDTLKRLQPDATIYLLKVYGVSRSVAEGTSYFSPQRLQEINDGIAGLADGKKVHCLDAAHLYCDDEGYMKEEYTSDGLHPYANRSAAAGRPLQITGCVVSCVRTQRERGRQNVGTL